MLLKKLHFNPVVVFKKLERHSFSQKKSARCELFTRALAKSSSISIPSTLLAIGSSLPSR